MAVEEKTMSEKVEKLLVELGPHLDRVVLAVGRAEKKRVVRDLVYLIHICIIVQKTTLDMPYEAEFKDAIAGILARYGAAGEEMIRWVKEMDKEFAA